MSESDEVKISIEDNGVLRIEQGDRVDRLSPEAVAHRLTKPTRAQDIARYFDEAINFVGLGIGEGADPTELSLQSLRAHLVGLKKKVMEALL